MYVPHITQFVLTATMETTILTRRVCCAENAKLITRPFDEFCNGAERQEGADSTDEERTKISLHEHFPRTFKQTSTNTLNDYRKGAQLWWRSWFQTKEKEKRVQFHGKIMVWMSDCQLDFKNVQMNSKNRFFVFCDSFLHLWFEHYSGGSYIYHDLLQLRSTHAKDGGGHRSPLVVRSVLLFAYAERLR